MPIVTAKPPPGLTDSIIEAIQDLSSRAYENFYELVEIKLVRRSSKKDEEYFGTAANVATPAGWVKAVIWR